MGWSGNPNAMAWIGVLYSPDIGMELWVLGLLYSCLSRSRGETLSALPEAAFNPKPPYIWIHLGIHFPTSPQALIRCVCTHLPNARMKIRLRFMPPRVLGTVGLRFRPSRVLDFVGTTFQFEVDCSAKGFDCCKMALM